MLFLITSEPNITSDLITLRYGDGVFRYNLNMWKEYRIAFTPNGWEVSNTKNDRKIDSSTVTRTFWWKAFSSFIDDDNLIREEIKYTITDIYGWCLERGIVKGNSPLYHKRLGKITILGKAKKYFLVPRTLVSVGLLGVEQIQGESLVAKSLSSEATNEKKVLMANEVDVSQLDPRYPWYLQEKINSCWDITVFYCNRRCFSFKRNREQLRGLDWRAEQFSSDQKVTWIPISLNIADENRIRSLSDELNIEFGRYDFLTLGDTDRLVFLELNASGQWVFLDPDEKYGLLECVVSWLKA